MTIKPLVTSCLSEPLGVAAKVLPLRNDTSESGTRDDRFNKVVPFLFIYFDSILITLLNLYIWGSIRYVNVQFHFIRVTEYRKKIYMVYRDLNCMYRKFHINNLR